MINLDDRIIDINLLNKSEFWLLMHLTKRINKDRKTFPGNELLCKETGFCLNTLQTLKKSLIQKGFLKFETRKHKGHFTSNEYEVCTSLISIYKPSHKSKASGDGERNALGDGERNAPTQKMGNGDVVAFTQNLVNGDDVGITQKMGNGDDITPTQKMGNGDVVAVTQNLVNGDVAAGTQNLGIGKIIAPTQKMERKAPFTQNLVDGKLISPTQNLGKEEGNAIPQKMGIGKCIIPTQNLGSGEDAVTQKMGIEEGFSVTQNLGSEEGISLTQILGTEVLSTTPIEVLSTTYEVLNNHLHVCFNCSEDEEKTQNQNQKKIQNQIQTQTQNQKKEINENYSFEKPPSPISAGPLPQNGLLFRETEYGNKDGGFQLFESKMTLRNSEYGEVDLEFYYHKILNWSDQGNRRSDWLGMAATFILNDRRDNKIQFKKNGAVTKIFGYPIEQVNDYIARINEKKRFYEQFKYSGRSAGSGVEGE